MRNGSLQCDESDKQPQKPFKSRTLAGEEVLASAIAQKKAIGLEKKG